MNASAGFVEKLLKGTPELRSAYEEHLADNEELLPHVFLGDVTRIVIEEAVNSRNSFRFRNLLDELELGLNSNENEVRELVAVSFVENLCGETEALTTLKPMMGSALIREVRIICGSG